MREKSVTYKSPALFMKLLQKSFTLFITLFILKCAPAHTLIDQDGDWQFWQYNQFFGNFTDKLGLMFEEEFRVGNNISELFYHHALVGLYYNPVDWFSFMPAYEQIFLREPGTKNWFPVYVPFLQFLFIIKGEKSRFINRTRLEYVMFDKESKTDEFLFRNLSFYILPFQFTKLKIQPYIGEEFFISSENGFKQNRVTGGFQIPIVREFVIDLFYRYVLVKPHDKWKYKNVIGLDFLVTF